MILFKYTELILTVSISSSWGSCTISISTSCTTWSLLLLHTFLKWPIFPHLPHVFPYAGHCLGAWLPPQYLHGHLWDVWCVVSLYQLLFGFWAILILSNLCDSVISFNMAACVHCTSTLLAHANTSSLVVSSLLLLVVSSLMTSSNMILSFNPWINCSLSCQSISL